MCLAMHVQITQNNTIDISLQYLKKEVSHEVDFLHANKHELPANWCYDCWWGMVKHSQSSQNKNFGSLPYLRREVRNEVDFLHADKHQNSPQVDLDTLCIKVSYKVILALLIGMIKHSENTQSNKFTISLQYLKKRS